MWRYSELYAFKCVSVQHANKDFDKHKQHTAQACPQRPSCSPQSSGLMQYGLSALYMASVWCFSTHT